VSDATIYRVRLGSPDRFQILLFDLPQVPREIELFNGLSKEEWWEAPPVYSDAPRREEPDFWRLATSATFVMSADLVESLGEFMHPVGELLRVTFVGRDEEFFALNILRDIDCLNPNAYAIDDLRVETEFLEHRLPDGGLFKIPQVDNLEIFYLERNDDDPTLRECIERRDLRGLEFIAVWSSDGSIEPVNLLSVS